MIRYSFVVDVEIDERDLSKDELEAIKYYVSRKTSIRKSIQDGIYCGDDAFRDIDPLRCVKVKVS